MKKIDDRDFTTYPRRFLAYRWYKPLLTGLLFILFYFLLASLVYLITSTVFHTTVSVTGYDDMNFYSTAGAFFNSAMGAVYIPALLLAAFFVKDRPLSSYFSSYCSSHSFSMWTRSFTGSMRSGTTTSNPSIQSTPEKEKLPESDLTNMNGDTIR